MGSSFSLRGIPLFRVTASACLAAKLWDDGCVDRSCGESIVGRWTSNSDPGGRSR